MVAYDASPVNKSFTLNLQRGRGTIIDQFLVIMWLIAIPLEFPLASPLRYPVAALVFLAALVHYRDVLPLLRRGSFFLILPALCLISALWSDAPFLSIRFGVFMMLGMVIAAFTAARLDHRQFVVMVFISSALLMVGSLLFMQTAFVGGLDGGYAMIGIFPHKNVFGMRMLVLIIAALAIIFDRGYGKFWRLSAIAAIPPALYCLFGSNSATSLVLLIATGFIVVALGVIWRPAAKVRGLRLIIAAGAIIMLAGGSLFTANVYRIDPYTELLSKLDKDSTLTGRTDIWQVGNQLIEERPILGVGAGAFWRPGVSKATQISTRFGAENNQFWFHNAYYEATVALGFVGLFVFLLTIAKAYWVLIKDWLLRQNQVDGFIMAVAAILLVRTFTESEFFSVFIMNPLIFWTGVFMALRRLNLEPGRLVS